MQGLKHRKNTDRAGATVFATSTILNYTPVFENPQIADMMVAAIMEVCRHHAAQLDAFIVMPEHVHLLLGLPPRKSGSQFMGSLKSATANWLLPHVPPKLQENMRLDSQSTDRAFWKPRPHMTEIFTIDAFTQKMDYIHDNPVRRGIVKLPEEYAWSSGFLYNNGFAVEGASIADLPEIAERWPSSLLPPLRGARRPE